MDKPDFGENGEDIGRNESQEQTAEVGNKNEILPKNPLLYLFVQYVWDPRHGPCYEGHEYKKLENWLETVEFNYHIDNGQYMIFRNSEGSPFCTPRKPISLISYTDFQCKTQDSRDMIILTHVAYHLRGIIKLLNSKKEDLIYGNNNGQPLLHAYLRECRNVPVDAPEHEVSIIRKVINRLIDMGAPLYAKDCYRETPFRIATMCKNHQILQPMIASLADCRMYDEFGNTALHIIVDNCVDEEGNHKNGYVDYVHILVSKGANINARNNNGHTPVHLSAGKFQTDILKFFADEGANFNERTNDDQTILQYTCQSTQTVKDSSKIIETFDFLLAQGCDLTVLNDEGRTLLHYAAEFQSVEIVERLIALGASVDRRSEKTLLTPLYLAAKGDKLDNMKVLVRAGADVNAEAADGSTPIFMSALVGGYESMQFLIDQGADLHRRDSWMGFTLLHMAANSKELIRRYKASTDSQTEQGLKKLEVLIEKGLDVNDPGHCGVTPLQLVILAPDVNAVKCLLRHGANVNFPRQDTPLELALQTCDEGYVRAVPKVCSDGQIYSFRLTCRRSSHFVRIGVYPVEVVKDYAALSCPIKKLWSCNGRSYSHDYLEIVSMLIAHGADVNVRSWKSGETPLHRVAFYKDGALGELLEAGAHVNVQDDNGRLPICKFSGRNSETYGLKLLLDFGANVNDDDVSQLFVSEICQSRDVVIMHAIKRTLIGLPIAKAYEPFVDAPEFADFSERCAKEATNLISHREDDGFSLYKFLRMNPKFQYHCIGKISRDYKNLEQLFPIYAGLIRGACRESTMRRKLLEPARIVWAENTDVHLPDVCVEHILSYLSNRYLEVMTTTIKDIKNTSVSDENVVFVYSFSN